MDPKTKDPFGRVTSGKKYWTDATPGVAARTLCANAKNPSGYYEYKVFYLRLATAVRGPPGAAHNLRFRCALQSRPLHRCQLDQHGCSTRSGQHGLGGGGR